MLRFVDLPESFKVLLLISLLLGMSAMLLLRMIISTHNRKYFIASYSIIFWLFSFALISLLLVEGRTGKPFVENYSVWHHVIFSAVQIIMCILGFIKEAQKRKTTFVRNSVKEAIDNLPIGLSFSNEKGRIILANKSMYHLVNRLMGKSLVNINSMWEELTKTSEYPDARKLPEYCTKDMVSLETKNQNVYQIMRRPIYVGFKIYYETKIFMVTRLHDLKTEISIENEQLKNQQHEIRNLAHEMIKINHEEELLNRKIQIHNTMGQYILATRQLLVKDSSREDYYAQAMDWQNMTRQFVSMEDKYKKNYSELLEEILSVADDIGCKVNIAENVPEEIFKEPLARQAIREAIINAVRHGQATSVDIETDTSLARNNLLITNNGSFDSKVIRPTGGLKNLQDGLRAMGGSLEFARDDKFGVKIIL